MFVTKVKKVKAPKQAKFMTLEAVHNLGIGGSMAEVREQSPGRSRPPREQATFTEMEEA